MSAVRVSITDMDGVLLDTFVLRHWRDDSGPADEDSEGFGSNASESGTMFRLKTFATEEK